VRGVGIVGAFFLGHRKEQPRLIERRAQPLETGELFSLSVAWAVSWRSQKPGLPVSISNSSWRALRRATSKTPPELFCPAFEIGYLLAHFAQFHRAFTPCDCQLESLDF
jgi:hypothetical protein